MTKRTVLGCLAALIAAIGLLGSFYWRYLGRGIALHDARIAAKLAPVHAAMNGGTKPDAALVARLAADPDVRNTLYNELREKGMQDIFPAEFRTFEAHAESELVYWLCHPNELQQPPDQIELMKVVTMPSGTSLGDVDYYLFRFSVNPPHWAADEGWMAGVAGPYIKGHPLDEQGTGATFSEFEAYEALTPERHVQYYHERAAARGLYEELAAQ